jgi:hypothetical protein
MDQIIIMRHLIRDQTRVRQIGLIESSSPLLKVPDLDFGCIGSLMGIPGSDGFYGVDVG